MIIGAPKEIKDNEYRVSLVPSGARALKDAGHRVIVQAGAGAGSSIPDEEYTKAGAEMVNSAEEVFRDADIVLKVKEPRPEEYKHLREGLIIFTFFHLAADPALAQELLKKGTTAVSYETVELDDGTLPVLAPMSEIAGRLSVQVGAHYLMKAYGGEGVLLSGVPGVERGRITIIGGGTVGLNAAKIAVGLGAEVTILDTRAGRFRYLDDIFGPRVQTLASNSHNLESALKGCDLLIGAVHIPGARTPRLISREMVLMMKKGSVVVDVSVDQGGCIETIRPTTHSNPVYEVDGIVHYGVANMPGAVPKTSTYALTNATLPYALKLANMGLDACAKSDPSIRRAINIHRGQVTNPMAAEALGKVFKPFA